MPSADPPRPGELYADSANEYPSVRRADRRIACQIVAAVGAAKTVLNVGAGPGSYERDLRVIAAGEPSAAMIKRRPDGAAPAVRARAEALPFAGKRVDVALAVLTIHHWNDLEAGLAEMVRAARERVVLLTWDPSFARSFWLGDYLRQSLSAWDIARFAPLDRLLALLPNARAETVPIPHDCTDGFLGAYWRRPHAYLSRSARLGISSLAVHEDALANVWAKLDSDLRSGAWLAQHGHLLERDALDLGYRLVVATI